MPAHEPRSWLIDMDGVIVREEEPIEGSAAFLAGLRARGMPFLVLTNNSIYTPSDLAARLRMSGVDVSEDDIWTSALATARFLDDQIARTCSRLAIRRRSASSRAAPASSPPTPIPPGRAPPGPSRRRDRWPR